MAIKQVTMPQLGESVTEGTISKWLVEAGAHVKKYEPIAEVMTDKVNAEVPSSFTGIMKELIAQEGDTLGVGEVICLMEVEEADSEERAGAPDIQEQTVPSETEKAGKQSKIRYSPAVRKLAREHNIDLTQMSGSGRGGRITRKDVMEAIESGGLPKKQAAPVQQMTVQPEEEAAASAASAPFPKRQQKKPSASPAPGDEVIPVTGLRRTIANNMVRSKQEIPHAWMMAEVDVTGLVARRNALKEEFKKKEGFPLTYFAFFVKAVAQALKEYPQINAMWAGDSIIQKKDIHLSIAVAAEEALFVPVIKHADEKSIKGMAREIYDLAEKARSGNLKAEDIQGGTFTVNNTGAFGSVQSMGIINYPQAAILQIETIVKRPVVMANGMIAVRDMVNVCLSMDHRVLDGLICGRFLQRVKEILENISEDTSVY
ncbi:dihydrolipoamide acetyltransferase family protein [Bacillus thermotolerans]|uniref:dihydrolipoamide acetyltransferase family protein n=1 Tax=Bacillus thermotolerans TaxID=1221996 RepID=UPI0005891DD6|nr:dihydrolipoamide acetyltransferase family protein [Bacillus thermotolerans]KKB43888.1 Dihydrolipoamide acyltransferase component of branched-chain alpha-keto acid dehydrogenase complex [Bacillus thermotolerans]